MCVYVYYMSAVVPGVIVETLIICMYVCMYIILEY